MVRLMMSVLRIDIRGCFQSCRILSFVVWGRFVRGLVSSSPTLYTRSNRCCMGAGGVESLQGLTYFS